MYTAIFSTLSNNLGHDFFKGKMAVEIGGSEGTIVRILKSFGAKVGVAPDYPRIDVENLLYPPEAFDIIILEAKATKSNPEGVLKESHATYLRWDPLVAAIETFGGHAYDSLVTPEGRKAAKEELVKKLEAAYPDEVEGVYFTDFVMQ